MTRDAVAYDLRVAFWDRSCRLLWRWRRVAARYQGELARLGDKTPGRVPDLAVLFQETAGHKVRGEFASQPPRFGPGANVHGEFNCGCPRHRKIGVEGCWRKGVDCTQKSDGVGRFVVAKPEPAAHQRLSRAFAQEELAVFWMQAELDFPHKRWRESVCCHHRQAVIRIRHHWGALVDDLRP